MRCVIRKALCKNQKALQKTTAPQCATSKADEEDEAGHFA
jgi:hypothetical protein